jgi:hypothetical protein
MQLAEVFDLRIVRDHRGFHGHVPALHATARVGARKKDIVVRWVRHQEYYRIPRLLDGIVCPIGHLLKYEPWSADPQSRGSQGDVGRTMEVPVQEVGIFDLCGNLPHDHLSIGCYPEFERASFRQYALKLTIEDLLFFVDVLLRQSFQTALYLARVAKAHRAIAKLEIANRLVLGEYLQQFPQ